MKQMLIETKVVMVRLLAEKRQVTFEWKDHSKGEDWYVVTHQMDVVDNDNKFDLGDRVDILLTKIE